MPALITSFDTAEDIGEGAHENNLSVAVTTGAGGVLLAGSTGEGTYLEPGERKLLTAITRRAFPDLTIVCGISAETDRAARTQVAEAGSGGADAVLVVTPGTLVRNRHRLITDFYRRIADASPLPILLYSVPGVTGYELPVESVAELAAHHNIVGMKDSGGNVSRLEALSEILGPKFIIYAGSSKALADSHYRGAHGAITASANYAFPLVDAAASGNREAQAALVDITTIVEHHGVAGTKFAASLAGMHPGSSRLPLQPLGATEQDEITAAYQKIDT